MTSISFPFRVGPGGGIAVDLTYEDQIKSQLYSLILTMVGERVMRPDFGTTVPGMLMEPVGSVLDAELVQQISEAVGKYISGVEIAQVRQTVDSDLATLHVFVSYRLLLTNQIHVVELDVGGGVNRDFGG